MDFQHTYKKSMAKNKRVISADTNILLRLLLGDVPTQTRSVETLFAKHDKIAVADAALLELVFVLEKIYHFKRDEVAENVFAIVRNTQFVCNKILFEKIMPLYMAETKLSIIDCALLEYARLNKSLPLYTFDKDLVKKSDNDACLP